MKTIFRIFLWLVILALAAAPISAVKAGEPNEVVLTAKQVTSAIDIEAAIIQATQGGTRPGVVTLDGRLGPFTYEVEEGADLTINIFVSDLTLHGIHDAVISNGEGIFFDGVPADRIMIKDLRLVCANDCIISWGNHRQVKLQNLQLEAGGLGIQVAQTTGWLIHKNTILAGGDGIHLLETSRISVQHNTVSGTIAVHLADAGHNLVKSNHIQGRYQGVLIAAPSSYNQVSNNLITGVEASGIALEPGTYGNRVFRNRVTCAPEAACQTVDATGEAWTDNFIYQNYP